MRVFSLLLCFIVCSTMIQGQENGQTKKEVEKEIIIIKKDSGDEETILKELKGIEGMEDIQAMIDKLTSGAHDSVDIDVDISIEDGATIRKYVTKTMVDGKEEVQEIIEKVNGDERKMIRKKIMVIDSDDKDRNNEDLRMEVIEIDDSEDITVIIEELEDEGVDSLRVNVEVNEIENGQKRKIVVKTIKDGKEEVKEIIEDVEEGDNSFTWIMNEEESDLPSPKVSMGVMIAEGTIIENVIEGSSAANAGLQKGDKLLKIDSQVIYSVNGLLEHLSSFKDGDKAIVTVERNGQTLTKQIVFKGKE